MTVYSLKNLNHLELDFNDVSDRIESLYDIKFYIGQTTAQSKVSLDMKHGMFSQEAVDVFNALVPKIKSLHKDMYSIIETVIKDKTGSFKGPAYDDKFKHFREFRLLNNQIKHYESKEAEIDVVSLIINYGDQKQVLEPKFTFKYKDGSIVTVPWGIFPLLFFQILEYYKVININRNKKRDQ